MIDFGTDKVPNFSNDKSKDLLSARQIVDKIEQIKDRYKYDDASTYTLLVASLADAPKAWLEIREKSDPEWVKTWPHLKAKFTEEYVTEDEQNWNLSSTAKLKPGDDFDIHTLKVVSLFQNFYERIGTTRRPIIYQDFEQEEALTAVIKANMRAIVEDQQMSYYNSTMPTDIQAVLKDRKPRSFMKMVEIAKTFWNRKNMAVVNKPTICAMESTNQPEVDDEIEEIPVYDESGRICAFQRQRRNFRGNTRPQNQQKKWSASGNNNQKNNYSSGGGSNKPRCMFCNKIGHMQDVCFSRIKQNQPCKTKDGKIYWPKKNNAAAEDGESNANSVSVFQ
jgi:hypothetical protein